MKLRALVAALGLSMILVAPSTVAVHGEAYTAYGTATRNGEMLLAEVYWSGYQPLGDCGSGWNGCFVVTLSTLDGTVVYQDRVPGRWAANGPVFYLFEILNYQGWAAEAGCSQTGCTHLFIRGIQGQQVAGGGEQRAIMAYIGNWWDWQLTLVVPYGIYL